jgi:Xaa-Pro aminopeptidase
MIGERTFRERREALIGHHPDGVILVRGGAGAQPNPSFFYLTGIVERRAALLLSARGVRIGTGARHPGPDYVRGRMVRQSLFLPRANELAARWGEESASTLDSASADRYEVDALLDAEELELVLGRALQESAALHYVRTAAPSLAGPDDADAAFVARVHARFFDVAVRDATPTVHEMRRLKDAGEVRALERSIELTREALERAVERLAPGVAESALEGEITAVYRAGGGTHAFDPIVACGVNAALPHYHANSASVRAGQLLLIDTGAVVGGYRSDVTRTYPVDGRFTPRQREVYETVLRAEREAIALCRPGALLADVHARAWDVIEKAGFGKHFIHGTGHHLGLETHDVGDVHRPLREGCVVTIEPGIYLPEEGIGVRIEDDVLVTDGAPRVLTAAIPAAVEAVERGPR